MNAANLIELYLNTEGTKFVAGCYYDSNQKPYKLSCSVHLGMTADSCLICCDCGIVCRYFPRSTGVKFYNTIYDRQGYSIPIRIHNADIVPIRIRFDRFGVERLIEAGEETIIGPFCKNRGEGGRNVD